MQCTFIYIGSILTHTTYENTTKKKKTHQFYLYYFEISIRITKKKIYVFIRQEAAVVYGTVSI